MAGNYPDGVTGNEYQISGADREFTDERTVYCPNENCEQYENAQDVTFDLQGYKDQEWGTWTCPVCKLDHEYEAEVDRNDGPDPDDWRDEQFARGMD
jgi:hypothetical protein